MTMEIPNGFDDPPDGIKRGINSLVRERKLMLEAGLERIRWVRDNLMPSHPAHARLMRITAELQEVVQYDMKPPHPEVVP